MEKKKSSKDQRDNKNAQDFQGFPHGFLDPSFFNFANPGFFPPPQAPQSFINPLLTPGANYPLFNPVLLQALASGVDPNSLLSSPEWQRSLLEQNAVPPPGFMPADFLFPNNRSNKLNAEKYGENSKSSSSKSSKNFQSSSQASSSSTFPFINSSNKESTSSRKPDVNLFKDFGLINPPKNDNQSRKNNMIKNQQFQPNNVNEYLLQAEMLRQIEQQLLMQQLQMQQKSTTESNLSLNNNMENSSAANKLQEQLSQAIFQQLLLNGQQAPFPPPEMLTPNFFQNPPAIPSSMPSFNMNSGKQGASKSSKPKDIGTGSSSNSPSLNRSSLKSPNFNSHESKNSSGNDEPFFASLYQQMQQGKVPKPEENFEKLFNNKIKTEFSSPNALPVNFTADALGLNTRPSSHKNGDILNNITSHSEKTLPEKNTHEHKNDKINNMELFAKLPWNEESRHDDMKNKIKLNKKRKMTNPTKVENNTPANFNNLFPFPNMLPTLPTSSMSSFDKACKKLYENTMLGNNVMSPSELTKVNEVLVTSIAVEMQRLEEQKLKLEEKLRKASMEETSEDGSASTSSHLNSVIKNSPTPDLSHGSASNDDESKAKYRRLSTGNDELNLPLQHGWQRESRFKDGGQLDVLYITPCKKQIKTYQELIKYLQDSGESMLKPNNFSFCSKFQIGKFYAQNKEDQSWKELTDEEVEKKMTDMDIDLKEAVLKYVSDTTRKNRSRNKDSTEFLNRSSEEVENAYAESLVKKEKNKQRHQMKMMKQHERLQKIQQQRIEKDLREQQAFQERQKLEALKQFKLEETLRKAKEKEQRRQQLLMLRAMENRKRVEERERKREELRVEKIMQRQKKIEQRQIAMQIARELKLPVEDMCITDATKLPELTPLQGTYDVGDEVKQLSGTATADLLMTMEFVNTFKEVLHIKKSDIPSVENMHQALLNDMNHIKDLVDVAIVLLHQCLCDPGVPAPGPWLNCSNGIKVTDVDVSDANFSEVLRLVVWGRSGYKTDIALRLETKSFLCLSPDEKAQCLAFLVNELVCSRPICLEIDRQIDTMATLRKDKWVVEGQIRQLRAAQERQESEQSNQKDESNQKSKEDSNSTDELQKQIDMLSQEHEQFQGKMFDGARQLRALNLGQDRFARRYWILPWTGGVFVESLESGLSYEDNIDINYESDASEEVQAKSKENENNKDNAKADEKENNIDKSEKSSKIVENESSNKTSVIVNHTQTSLLKPTLSNDSVNKDVKITNENIENDCTKNSESISSIVSSSTVKINGQENINTDTEKVNGIDCSQDVPMDLSKSKEIASEPKHNNENVNSFSKPQLYPVGENPPKFPTIQVKQEFTSDFLSKYLSNVGYDRSKDSVFSVMDIGQTEWLNKNANVKIQKFDPSISTQGIANALINAENSNLAFLDKVTFPVRPPDVLEKPEKIPKSMQYGWWRVPSEKDVHEIQHNLSTRGIREKHLQRMVTKHFDYCVEAIETSKVKTLAVASDDDVLQKFQDSSNIFHRASEIDVACEVERKILDSIEDLWSRCEQIGIISTDWSENRKPSEQKDLSHYAIGNDSINDTTKFDMLNPVPHHEKSILGVAVKSTMELERLISRTYLKPPLVRKGGATEFSNLPSLSESGATDVAAGLRTWRNAVASATSPAQLALCIDMLGSSIAWEKCTQKLTTRMEVNPSKPKRKKAEKRQAAPKPVQTISPRKKKKRSISPAKPEIIQSIAEPSTEVIKEEAEVNKNSVGSPQNIISDEVAAMCADHVAVATDTINEVVNNVVQSACSEIFEGKKMKKNKKKKKKSKKSKHEKDKKEKKEKKSKKNRKTEEINSDADVCKKMLNELQSHQEATWFLFPVDCKIVPGYRKVIKKPIDFHTIENRLNKMKYKSSVEFAADVRLVFNNCEIFNEDESPIGRAGHLLRNFFESRWKELTCNQSKPLHEEEVSDVKPAVEENCCE